MSSRWEIDVYDGSYKEPPIMNGWLLDQPESSMRSSSWTPRMKPTIIPSIYAEEVCHINGGEHQCRFLERRTVHSKDRFTCHKNTSRMPDINRKVQQAQDVRTFVGTGTSSHSIPMGNNCEGIQMLHSSVLERYEGTRTPAVILDLTIFQFENMIIDCLRKAYEHLETTLHNQKLQGKSHTAADRLGMFCTSVRSYINMAGDKMKCDETRYITNILIKTENWTSVLVPKHNSYGYGTNKITLADGEWTLNTDKLTELAKAAQTGYRFISDEAVVQSECTASLLLVERSIPTLNALADQARLINLESDRVIQNMVSIAESLER
jgi:hypothetical protein